MQNVRTGIFCYVTIYQKLWRNIVNLRVANSENRCIIKSEVHKRE